MRRRFSALASQALAQRRKRILLDELKLCSTRKTLARGREVHAEIVACGFESCSHLASALINMYSKCGSMLDARQVFDSMKHPDIVSWNTLILGYATNGEGITALDMFARMRSQGCAPYSVTFMAALKACTSLAQDQNGPGKAECLAWGKDIHLQIGFHSETKVRNALIDMYSKCGSMVDARRVFDSIQHPDVVSWTALILGYADSGEGLLALDMFSRMKSQGCAPNYITFISAIKACTSLAHDKNGAGLARGKQVHSEIGYHLDAYVQNSLIDMYAKCGSMADARLVFDSIKQPDVVSWNALLLGYVENGNGITAMDLFVKMRSQGCAQNSLTFIAALKACSSLALDQSGSRAECLKQGKEIHSQIGRHLDASVQNTLIDMYAKCGSMADALHVFDTMKQPGIVSWNALILGYALNREGITALDTYARMRSQGCAPSSITFIAAVKACTSLALDLSESGKALCLEKGKQIHQQFGCRSDVYVESTLIDMYAKCGSMANARQVFDSMKDHSIVAWNALLLGYADSGQGVVALDLFERMRSRGCAPNAISFIAAVKACASLAVDQTGSLKAECLERVREIHAQIGCHLDIYVQGTLIDVYSKCGSMRDARRVFDGIMKPDVVSWTALILGYADNGEGTTALDVFAKMKYQGCQPSSITFIAVLKACSSLALQNQDEKAECLERAREMHSQIGCCLDMYVENTMIDMYAKCGSMVDARQVFDGMKQKNSVSWNSLLSGYAENGDSITALEVFATMRSHGCPPDSITFVAVLKACGLLGAYETGGRIHAEINTATACDTILVTSLVDFYGKCGSVVEAQKVFDLHARARNLVTWNALLAGYSRLGDSSAVFRLFGEMQDAGFQPDVVTFLCVLSCCSHAGLVEKAAEFFEAIPTKFNITPTVDHYSCMLDILGRSNKLDDAMALLRSMPFWPNTVAWMTVLGACRKWKNASLGRLAFKTLVALDDRIASPYVAMAPIHESRGMWEEQKVGKNCRAWNEPGQTCWTNEKGEVHMFLAGSSNHPQSLAIQDKLLRDGTQLAS